MATHCNHFRAKELVSLVLRVVHIWYYFFVKFASSVFLLVLLKALPEIKKENVAFLHLSCAFIAALLTTWEQICDHLSTFRP